MFSDERSKFLALSDWFLTAQGCRIAENFVSVLESITEFMKGQRLLQLGSFGENPWLSVLSYSKKWLASPVLSRPNSTFLASMDALPVDRHSIDCLVAPFSLELSSNKRNLINEIDRILAPMGYAIFFGINPWSLWGLALRLFPLDWFAKAPLAFCSALALKHILLNQGYTQCFLSDFYFIPPLNSEKLIHKLEFLNEMGKMMWPCPASFYCLIVQKYEPALATRQVLAPGLLRAC